MLRRQNSLKINQDRFLRLSDVSSAMCEEGMSKCGLIFGLIANSMDPDETAQMHRLIWIHAGRKRTWTLSLLTKACIMAENTLRINQDRFSNLRELGEALVEGGLKKCSLIFGIDYTMSNKVQGEKTFDGRSLHDTTGDCLNPYQEVICILGETLQPLDADGLIPAYGFGDYETKGDSIFSLKEYGSCVGFREVLQAYNRITPNIKLYRPTNFAPLIRKAIDIVRATKKYHILVIAADGQVNSEEETIQAIVEASDYPLSIICIGVGDGPWGMMKEFDMKLPKRNFDNFQFVNFHEVMCHAQKRQTAFALHALMEIPDQYHAIQELGLFEKLYES